MFISQDVARRDSDAHRGTSIASTFCMGVRGVESLQLVVAVAEKRLGPQHPATIRRREQLQVARAESDRRGDGPTSASVLDHDEPNGSSSG